LLLAGAASVSAAAAETLTGNALIRERIALPPGSTFEAVIADISRADAPAQPLARTVIDDPGQPPIAFAVEYDPPRSTRGRSMPSGPRCATRSGCGSPPTR